MVVDALNRALILHGDLIVKNGIYKICRSVSGTQTLDIWRKNLILYQEERIRVIKDTEKQNRFVENYYEKTAAAYKRFGYQVLCSPLFRGPYAASNKFYTDPHNLFCFREDRMAEDGNYKVNSRSAYTSWGLHA